MIFRLSPPRCSRRRRTCGHSVFNGNFSDHSRITMAALAKTSSMPRVSKSWKVSTRYKSPWNTLPPTPYSCRSVKVGLVTSSSSAARRPATMPFVSVVFLVPNSPLSKTSTGGWSVSARARPQATVCSAECVITSSATRLQLLEQFPARIGYGVRDFAGKNAGFVGLRTDQLRGAPVQIRAECDDAVQICGSELRDQRREQARQHITGAAFGQSGVAGGVHEDIAIWRGNHGVKAF